MPLKERARIQEQWLRERLKTVLPQVMKSTGFDMWIIMTDEQNEDPVTKTLLPASMINARGKMILVFTLMTDGTVKCESVSRPSGIENIYCNSWYGITDTDWKGKKITPPTTGQLEYVRQLVERYNPQTIGINMDEEYPYCDGLSASNYATLGNALGEYGQRLKPARNLATGWMETRCPGEIAAYDGIVQLAHAIIGEIFSPACVTPGITTVDDLAAAFTQRIIDLGLKESFESSCAVFRHNDPGMHNEGYVIQPGDILHCDIGIEYLGLCTDTQQLAYILRPGETQAPAGLCHALKVGNRLQDIVCSKFATGKTGNQILAEARKQAESEEIIPCIYSHPLGVFAHAPGPSIGFFGNQEASEHGKLEIHPYTAYSLELNTTVNIAEWDNQALMTCIETDILFDGKSVYFMAERQTELILIR
jgi:Xaa-Pro aminopeptidase